MRELQFWHTYFFPILAAFWKVNLQARTNKQKLFSVKLQKPIVEVLTFPGGAYSSPRSHSTRWYSLRKLVKMCPVGSCGHNWNAQNPLSSFRSEKKIKIQTCLKRGLHGCMKTGGLWRCSLAFWQNWCSYCFYICLSVDIDFNEE